MSGPNEKGLVNQTELARLFDVTPKSIRAWSSQGCPVEREGKRGQPTLYRPADVIRWREERAALAAAGDIAMMDMEEARRRKLAAEAATAELALARAKDEVVEVELVSKVVGNGLAAVRARLLQIGAKIAPQAEIAPDATAIKELVDDAIYEALDEISGDALAFGGAADREADEGVGAAADGNDVAASEADAKRVG